MASKIDTARRALASQRKKARESRGMITRKAAMVGTSYGIGSLEQSGRMDSIPRLFGMPRTLTVGAASLLASMYVSGAAGDALEGVADGALSVAAYQFASGGEVSGDREELAQLEGELDRLESVSGDEEVVVIEED